MKKYLVTEIHVGDKSQFEDRGFDEADEQTYICSCGFEKEVAVQYDLFSRFFYPIKFSDTQCPKCNEFMDRKVAR